MHSLSPLSAEGLWACRRVFFGHPREAEST